MRPRFQTVAHRRHLSAALAQVADADEDIKQAIRDAKARIERERSPRKGLEIVASLVTLAAALASSDTKRIVVTGKAVVQLGSCRRSCQCG